MCIRDSCIHKEVLKIGRITILNEVSYSNCVELEKFGWGESYFKIHEQLKEKEVLESTGGKIRKNRNNEDSIVDSIRLFPNSDADDIDTDIDIF